MAIIRGLRTVGSGGTQRKNKLNVLYNQVTGDKVTECDVMRSALGETRDKVDNP